MLSQWEVSWLLLKWSVTSCIDEHIQFISELLIFTVDSFSLQEYSLVISQLSSHIAYLSSSTIFILHHTSSKVPSPITTATEPREQEQLTNQVQAVVAASEKLFNEVKDMEIQVYTVSSTFDPCKQIVSFYSLGSWETCSQERSKFKDKDFWMVTYYRFICFSFCLLFP